MNGAESLVRTLVGGGVNVCFANPGTSEMHFVAALDRVEGMRCVLGLFEGVVTGAADGYARMTDNPAATLLHLGPGLANGLANIHNANKAVDADGQHRRRSCDLSPPLRRAADLRHRDRRRSRSRAGSRPRPMRRSVAADGAAAIAAARTPPGQIATLILPADTAWNEGSGPGRGAAGRDSRAPVSPEAVDEAARVLRSGEPCLLLRDRPRAARGGARARRPHRREDRRAADRAGLQRPHPARARAGCSSSACLMSSTRRSRCWPGSSTSSWSARRCRWRSSPIRTSRACLSPPDAVGHVLARPEEDLIGALDGSGRRARRALDAGAGRPTIRGPTPATGAITSEALGASLGALLPENAIVVDEAVTTGRGFFRADPRGAAA